jgi:hypothetical protein
VRDPVVEGAFGLVVFAAMAALPVIAEKVIENFSLGQVVFLDKGFKFSLDGVV